MSVVRLHPAEKERLAALRSYAVADPVAQPLFDRLAMQAADICRTQMASVTLVGADRNWFKATVGLRSPAESSRAWSFCSQVVADGVALILADARAHPRYRNSPLVTGEPYIRAYAGLPLIGRERLPLGTLCVSDQRPKTFDRQSLQVLSALAEQVVGPAGGRAPGRLLPSRSLARISTQPVRGNGSADFVAEGAVVPPGDGGVVG